MASIITATTTSGLTQSADNSGVLQLASGTGNLVTVPSVTGTAMVSGNMPAFSAYRSSSNQTFSSNTATKLQFQTEEFDTASCYDNATNYRFTPNVAGYYQVNAHMNNAGTATFANLSIYKNGSIAKNGVGFASTFENTAVSALIYLNGTTDYIELYAFVTGTPSVGSGTGQGSYFQAVLVRGA